MKVKRMKKIFEETLCYLVGLAIPATMIWMLTLPMLSAESDAKRINEKFGTTYTGSDLLVPTDEIRELYKQLR